MASLRVWFIKENTADLLVNPEDFEQFLKIKDIGHFITTSKEGSSNSFENWDYEDFQINRAIWTKEATLNERINASSH